jgi:hypothetical protein
LSRPDSVKGSSEKPAKSPLTFPGRGDNFGEKLEEREQLSVKYNHGKRNRKLKEGVREELKSKNNSYNKYYFINHLSNTFLL